MQNITYTLNSGLPLSLWRGIPAQLTIKGVADTSGNWIFLVDSDYFDGAILSGAVTASGADLIVTISEMNTVELSNAIKGRSQLICRATLTDGVTQVQLIQIAVKNRAVSGTPTPVAEYYTKAQIDAIIADLPTAPVLSVNSKTGDVVLDASDVGAIAEPSVAGTTGQVLTKTAEGNAWQNVPDAPVSSVNNKTGAVTLDASDVGAVPAPATAGSSGEVLTQTANGPAWLKIDWSRGIIAAGAAITPEAGKVYAHTLAAGDVLSFDTSGLGARQADFEVHLTQPATAVAVTFPAGIKWEKDGVFSAENDAPDLSTGGRTYILTFRWTGSALLGNLAGEVR